MTSYVCQLFIILIYTFLYISFLWNLGEFPAFKHDRAFNVAMEHLKSSKIVLITGKQYTGKRTLIYDLKKDFQHYKFIEPRYKRFRLDKENPFFICVTHTWISHYGIDRLEKELSKLHRECVVVFELPIEFLHTNATIEEKYQHVIVDLSSKEFELNAEEKLKIVNDICHHKDVSEQELSEEKRTELSNYKPVNYGFLHLCHALFRADKESLSDPLTFIREQDNGPCMSGKFQSYLLVNALS